MLIDRQQAIHPTPDPARWHILAVLLTAQFMSLVGISIVNVVLPSIQQGVGASQADLQWVLSGYSLAFGVVLIAAGRAGDVLGRGAFFIIGVAIFTLASVVAGLATDPLSLNIARFVQGAGSGLINPQVMGMMQQNFRGRELGKAYGFFGTVAGISVAVGPLLGGVLIALLGAGAGWRWTFLVNVPIALTTIILACRWFPRPLFSRTERERLDARGNAQRNAQGMQQTRRDSRDLDPVGCVLLGLAVLTFLLPFVQGRETAWVWWLLPTSLVLLGLWIAWERSYASRGRFPMVDLTLFGIGSFSLGNIIGGLYYLGITSVWVLVAIYTQQGQGFSALQAGLLGLPSALFAAASSHWAGRRVTDYGRKIVIWGIFSALLGLGLSIGVIELHAIGNVSLWWLLVTLSFMGIAQGAIISPNQTLTMLEVPVEQSGTAGGLTQAFQRIGTAVGIAMITAVFFSTLRLSTWDTAMSVALASIGMVVVITLIVALGDQRRRNANGRQERASISA
ncbi:MFS transporter [Arthrobacter sp. MA-N2]|uniref:MFS transporter n=1 Tax=Arthrobacter sp. MA-N2 TaxID=1101188 RepID=UPI0004B8D39E|nr:MFS transporter [Arthrobacter sp. MA-N2]